MKQRNNILSFNNGDTRGVAAQLAAWNEVLAAEGINVTYGRLKYFTFLKKCAGDIYSDLTDGAEKLSMEYISSVFKTESIDFDNIDELYKKHLSERPKDR